MRLLVLALTVAALLVACASNPLLTGQPQDWKGKPAADLRAAWGEPSRIIAQTKGGEIWEYRKSGEFVAPKEENTAFRMGGGEGGGLFNAAGGIKTTKQGERLSQYENVFRFRVDNGKVREWFAERLVDGARVWSDH